MGLGLYILKCKWNYKNEIQEDTYKKLIFLSNWEEFEMIPGTDHLTKL